MQPNITVGRYHILRPLGAGGMGAVYLAKYTRLKRRVAIKVLPERLRSARNGSNVSVEKRQLPLPQASDIPTSRPSTPSKRLTIPAGKASF